MLAVALLVLALSDGAEQVVVPPQVHLTGKDISSCLSRFVPSEVEGEWPFEFIVETDGSASSAPFLPGTEVWQMHMTECLLGRAKFSAGTVDGSPVTAKAVVPISLIRERQNSDIEFESAKLLSTSTEVEDAYRACYPPDSLAMQTSHYKLTIGKDGIPRDVKLVESGGDAVLDQAGLCIIEKLRFKPTLRGKAPVRSSIVLPLQLRPAR